VAKNNQCLSVLICVKKLCVFLSSWLNFMLKKATFLHFSCSFSMLFDVFLHFLAFFYSFSHFLTLFSLPIFPIYPNRTLQSPFLAHQQGFALESAEISPQNPQIFKKFS